jgi:type III pantothenate kinase
MLLAVNIGNTTILLGVFKDKELIATWRLATNINTLPDEYASILMNLLNHRKLELSDIKDVAVSSVVPPLTGTFQELSQRYCNTTALVVEAGVKTGVRIRMDNPKEVGADRIANAAAGHHLYGGPLIIADFGTATAFDTISKEGDYMGGAVAPGMVTAADALVTHTSRLQRVELVRPKKAIGTNTIAAMQSGIIFGYVGLVEGIVTRIQKELDAKAMVIATGGLGEMIAKETNIIDKVDPDLKLVGLRLIYEMNRPE